jgi:hypothetical protein
MPSRIAGILGGMSQPAGVVAMGRKSLSAVLAVSSLPVQTVPFLERGPKFRSPGISAHEKDNELQAHV